MTTAAIVKKKRTEATKKFMDERNEKPADAAAKAFQRKSKVRDAFANRVKLVRYGAANLTVPDAELLAKAYGVDRMTFLVELTDRERSLAQNNGHAGGATTATSTTVDDATEKEFRKNALDQLQKTTKLSDIAEKAGGEDAGQFGLKLTDVYMGNAMLSFADARRIEKALGLPARTLWSGVTASEEKELTNEERNELFPPAAPTATETPTKRRGRKASRQKKARTKAAKRTTKKGLAARNAKHGRQKRAIETEILELNVPMRKLVALLQNSNQRVSFSVQQIGKTVVAVIGNTLRFELTEAESNNFFSQFIHQ